MKNLFFLALTSLIGNGPAHAAATSLAALQTITLEMPETVTFTKENKFNDAFGNSTGFGKRVDLYFVDGRWNMASLPVADEATEIVLQLSLKFSSDHHNGSYLDCTAGYGLRKTGLTQQNIEYNLGSVITH